MKFFLDENFPKAAVGMLQNDGHEVFDLRGTDREGARDAEIFAEAQRHGAIFLTADRVGIDIGFACRRLVHPRDSGPVGWLRLSLVKAWSPG